MNLDKIYPAYPNYKELTVGHEDGTDWVPAECDVSIRPGWFYSPDTDGKVKSVKKLEDIYYGSIGRGGNLILNVPVDRRGLIAREDSTRLMEFRSRIEKSFHKNLANHATVVGSYHKGYSTRHLTDGNTATAWAPAGDKNENQFTLVFNKPVRFNRLVLQEDITLGQRVKEFSVEVKDPSGFREIAHQTTIGHKRILQLPDSEASQIRVTILSAKAKPVISEVGLYWTED
jgi:alpha-L-fucosidase